MSADRRKVGVVGSGAVGLAAAYELTRLGVEVRCYEAAEPMQARSLGDTRIFRLAHRDPRLVDLARRALTGWRRWETQFGVPLVGRETVVVSGPGAAERAEAMAAVGAPHLLLDRPAPELRLPARRPTGPFLIDEEGGVLAARETGRVLLTALGSVVRASDPVRHLHVLPAGGVRIESTNESWDCDVVLVLAGAGTGPLLQTVDHPEAAAVGPPAQRRHHHRFTFRLVSPGRRPRCWLDQSGDFAPDFTTYQHLVGPGRWAIGGSLSDADTAWELGPEETRERARQVVGAYVREQLDGIEPEVVEIVHCDAIGTGDGISTTQLGPVLALWGDNLFKHVPVLGELLARGGRDGRIPDVLLGLDPAAPRPQVSEPARPSGP